MFTARRKRSAWLGCSFSETDCPHGLRRFFLNPPTGRPSGAAAIFHGSFGVVRVTGKYAGAEPDIAQNQRDQGKVQL
jgi:hypothetical protein